MVGYHIVRGLVLMLVYVYPAYECFKTAGMNKPDVKQLLFWCHYWILVVVLTVCERIAHMFIVWFHKTKRRTEGQCSSLLASGTSSSEHQEEHQEEDACSSPAGTTSSSDQPQAGVSKHFDLFKPTAAAAAPSKVFKMLKKYLSNFQSMNGKGRRTVWFLLAQCSWEFYAVHFENDKDTNIKKWFIQQVEKVEIYDELKEWLNQQFEKVEFFKGPTVQGLLLGFIHVVVIATYVSFLFYLAYIHKIKPLKLSRVARWFFECVFVLLCLGVAYFVKDFWGTLFAFGICFHIIPVFNLLGAYENFGLLDCLLAILIEVALFFCKNPKYAPCVVAVISVAFQLTKQSLYDEHSKRTLLPH